MSTTVTGLSTLFASTAGPTLIQILGTNLTLDPSMCAAILPVGTTNAGLPTSYPLYFTNQTDPSNVFLTPPAYEAGTYLIAIFESQADLDVGNSLYIYNSFSYGPPPTINSASPAYDLVNGGTTITIGGTDLSGATSVMFGSVAATSFTVNSTTQITCVDPSGSIGPANIVVTTPYGSSAPLQFYYGAPPIVKGFSTQYGPGPVVIRGANFLSANSVFFVDSSSGSVSATDIVVVNSSEITCNQPISQVPGSEVTVVVTTPYGSSTYTPESEASADARIAGTSTAVVAPQDGDGAVNVLPYKAAPAITRVPTMSTSGGGTAELVGTNFGVVTAVLFDAASVQFSDVIDTGLTVTAPARSAGPVNIVVQSTHGTSPSFQGTYAAPAIPVSDICFPKGTLIVTNQGKVAIEKINPAIHTIRNKKIEAVTKTVTQDKHLICFEKHSLGNNVPSQQTIISRNHSILYNGKMIQAKEFIGKFDNVYKTKYDGEVLYNVLMETHDKMMVNNLICETLDPENCVAKLYMELKQYDIDEQQILIKQLNEHVNKKNMLKSKK